MEITADSNHDALSEIATIAGNLAAGNGGPERYRKPASGMNAMDDFQKAGLKVACLPVPHTPVAAMCVTGFILYGLDFELHYQRLGITGDLGKCFYALERHYGHVAPRSSARPKSERTPAAPAPRDIDAALEAASRPRRMLGGTIPAKGRGLSAPAGPARPALPGGPARPALPGRA